MSGKINNTDVIQGAIDNFNHIDNTLSDKDTTHDTILVIFQNQPKNKHTDFSNPEPSVPSSVCQTNRKRERKCSDILPCQILEKSETVKGSSKIPQSFNPSQFNTT